MIKQTGPLANSAEGPHAGGLSAGGLAASRRVQLRYEAVFAAEDRSTSTVSVSM